MNRRGFLAAAAAGVALLSFNLGFTRRFVPGTATIIAQTDTGTETSVRWIASEMEFVETFGDGLRGADSAGFGIIRQCSIPMPRGRMWVNSVIAIETVRWDPICGGEWNVSYEVSLPARISPST